MVNLRMYTIVIIMVLVTANLYLFTSWRNTANENATLQEALKHPQVIRLPVEKTVVTPPKIVTRTVYIEKQGDREITRINEETKDQGPTVESFKDQGMMQTPVVPGGCAGSGRDRFIDRLSLFGAYDAERRFSLGVGIQPFKLLPVTLGGGYRQESGVFAWVMVRL
jgi:hypothetical protein